LTGSLRALIIPRQITSDTPIIMHTETKTFPARNTSMVSLESDDIMRAGVARYMTKSFIGVRSIFLHFPKK
jgi:hypothetical protein